jgi:uncharacterized membrane protein YdjX (TVP38/TMEM64 family)
MNEQFKDHPLRLKLAVGLLSLILITGAVLWWTGHMAYLMKRMYEIFQSREHLRLYVESWGVWAPAVFIFIQGLQVVIAPIPGELTGAVGGFIFGAIPNVLYSTLGLTIGSVLAFGASRIIGLPLVEFFVPSETLEKFHFLTERKGVLIALAFFTIPGFPKDILCYILGLSPMGILPFALICGLGRIPGTILLSYSGSAVYNEDWTLLIAMAVVCAILLAAFYFARGRIDGWLATRSRRLS